MELVRGLHNVDRAARGCVLTIGAFDGIHRGHQEMIRVLRGLAAKHSLPAALLSFEPTPREFFAKATPPARLTRFREKYEALRHYGVERFVCLRFDSALRSLSADEFVGKVLVEALGARHVVVGHDFKFGRNMAGNVATLRTAGPAAGFAVTEVPPFEIDGERVSSSLIRAALENHPPPMHGKLRPKIYYATQVGTQPPTIVLVCNEPGALQPDYRRYLLGVLRDYLKFSEIPIKLYLKKRAPRDKQDEIKHEPEPVTIELLDEEGGSIFDDDVMHLAGPDDATSSDVYGDQVKAEESEEE